MSHTVVIHRRAERDLYGVMHRLESERSFSVGFRWFTRAHGAIDSLSEQPERYPLAVEADELGIGLRMLLYGRKPSMFRILYVIDGSIVHVLRVRHTSQDRISLAELT